MAFLSEAGPFFASVPHAIAWAADPGLVMQAPGPACETQAIAGACDKRRREFRSGRNLARQVLSELGAPAQGLPTGPDRRPIWPEGIRGSISHCDDLAIVVAARGLEWLGVDVEPAGALPREVARHIMTGADLDMQAEASGLWRGVDAPTLVFCAKEAFYKAVSHQLPFVPDFTEAAIRPFGVSGYKVLPLSVRLRALAHRLHITGHWHRAGAHIVTLAVPTVG